MRIRAVLAAAALAATAAFAVSCAEGGRGDFFRQYEYEEEVYLSLDGTATVYVHSSLAALNALRGTTFDTSPNAPLDRDAVREFFSTPVTGVNGRVNASRRRTRRFVHVRLEVAEIERLAEAAPFAWSRYEFRRDGELYVFRQRVGAPARPASVAPDDVGWNGEEIVAFRLHLPSRIAYHNSENEVGRGNILSWEQPLTARLNGAPIVVDARMESESILYSTLRLFGITAAAVALTFVFIIWWTVRRAPAETRVA
jgi:hypothetical protein